jgi:hypothetical protein
MGVITANYRVQYLANHLLYNIQDKLVKKDKIFLRFHSTCFVIVPTIP